MKYGYTVTYEHDFSGPKYKKETPMKSKPVADSEFFGGQIHYRKQGRIKDSL